MQLVAVVLVQQVKINIKKGDVKIKKILICLVLVIGTSTLANAEEKVINFEDSVNSTVKIEVGNYKGSGVLISNNLVLTVNHLVNYEDNINITFYDKTKVKGKLIKTEPWNDLALIEIEKVKYEYVEVSSDKINFGDKVYTIGHPLTLDFVLSESVITNPNQLVGFQSRTQFDGIIYPGNSGGALLNSKGELIGIVANILKEDDEYFIGLNFATQLKYIKEFLKGEIK